MEDLNLNLSEITSGTYNLSDMSFSIDTPLKKNNKTNDQSGGFFGLFSSSTPKVETAVLEAAKEKNMSIVEFMIDKDLISSYDSQDKDGNTLLHYLVSTPNPNINLVNKVLKRGDIKKFINKQNNDGDTPLIIAVKSGHHDLCTSLISAGANKTIKNKSGLHVDTETEEHNNETHNNLPTNLSNDLSVGKFKDSPSFFEFQTSPKEVEEIMEPIRKLFNRTKQNNNYTSEPASIQLSDKDQLSANDTETFIEKLKKQLNGTKQFTQSKQESNDTEETVKQLNYYLKNNQSKGQQGGDCGCNNGETDNLLMDFDKYFKQGGGKKSKTLKSSKSTKVSKPPKQLSKSIGTRKVKTYKDLAMSSEDRGTELSRVINDQTSEIISRSIKAIQTIITDNKKELKDLSGDETTARAIKAIIWKSLREKNPDMKSSMDIAIEMEKLITKDYIAKISLKDIKEMNNILNKNVENKKNNKKTTTSESSSESNYSASSI